MSDELSSRKLRKLRLLEIITTKSVNAMDMAHTLKQDGVITENQLANLAVSQNKPEEIFRLLENARKSNIIDLLDYEWQALPSQKLVLTIVTPSGIREFRHEEP